MSHTVTLHISSLTQDIKCCINRCNEVLDSLITSNKTNTKLVNYFEKYKNNLAKEFENLQQHEKDISNKYGDGTSDKINVEDSQWLNILRRIDSINKEVANLTSNKNIIEWIIQDYEKDQQDILNLVKDLGKIAEQAISNLREKTIEINLENIKKEIEEIRNIELYMQKQKEIKDDLFSYISNQKFDDKDLDFQLKNIVITKNSIQELNDCYAFINSKKYEESKIDNFAESFFTLLEKNEGFKLIKDITIKTLDDDGIIRKKYKLKNSKNNVIDIIIDGNLQIKYQLGNYVGHACEKTSDKIFDSINKLKYRIVHKTISRNISNAKPLTMKMALNK